MDTRERLMREAIRLAAEGVRQGHGGPFGALVARGDEILGRGWNRVILDRDPTAHAEIMAIRAACQRLGDFRLNGCELYTSCEPCPMCLAAAYWARLEGIWHAATARDAAAIGFDDQHIRQQLIRPMEQRVLRQGQILREEALVVFRQWRDSPRRVAY